MSKKQNFKIVKRFCDMQQGFSLIELAVVLLVVGVIVGGATGMIAPYLEAKNYKTTKAKMEKIADALAIFAQSNYTLPCPAYPHKNNIEHFGSSDPFSYFALCTSRNGVVPFRKLGLTEEDVTDAYGNLITYAVSEVFDQYRSGMDDVDDTSFFVHRDCHSPAWKGNMNFNINKAKFCCPAANGAVLNIRDGRTGGSAMFENQFGACNLDGEWADPVPSLGSCSTPHETETIAFVLLSRGREGVGAFLPTADDIKDVNFIPANAEERGNIGDENNFVSRPISLNRDPDYFDDIVVYRTNHQLISAFGTDSCAYP